MDCSLPGSSIHGIFQARVLEWGAITFSTPWLYEAIIMNIPILASGENWDYEDLKNCLYNLTFTHPYFLFCAFLLLTSFSKNQFLN